MSGWPQRPSRRDYGGTMRDERRVSDPRSELGASVLNLMFWQGAALGVLAPKASLLINPVDEVGPSLLWGAFAWDQRLYAGVQAPLPYFAVQVAFGYVGLEFDATVADQEGQQVPLQFAGGAARIVGLGAPTDRRYRESVQVLGPHSVRVQFTTGASTPVTGPFAVLLW